ncbi:unnamed protein product [Phytophthora fragariaefolia]|uniref:Unnamed protein product n=1 Tax=Phytophthora fragariaefolia TaxID=1490495 RepID=A0A9W6WV95_9STRA|nr:unnamed protein product [Phytophthora fragariaefolia]
MFVFNRLLVGLSTASNEFQAFMVELLGDLPFVWVYLDDILVISWSFRYHMEHLNVFFTRLCEEGLTLHPKESRICADWLDCLDCRLSKSSIEPIPTKVEEIAAIGPLCHRRDLRRFAGMVKYYRDMLLIPAELISPFTFRSLLLDQDSHLFTDYLNLTYSTSDDVHMMHWRLEIEEFGPVFHYVPGNKNVIADALYRLPATDSTPTELEQKSDDLELVNGLSSNFAATNIATDDALYSIDMRTVAREQDNDDSVPMASKRELGWLIYPGASTMEAMIDHEFTWLSIKQDATKIVEACLSCTKAKHPTLRYGKLAPTTVHNPHADGVIEREHRVIGDKMRTNTLKTKDDWDQVLNNTTFPLRAAHYANDPIIPRTATSAPRGSTIQVTRCCYAAKLGFKANILPLYDRPYEIIAVQDNGTLTLDKGQYIEKVNLRRVRPTRTNVGETVTKHEVDKVA